MMKAVAKKMQFLLLGIMVFAIVSFTAAKVIEWKLTPDYSIKFKNTEANGSFSKLSGVVVFDPEDLNQSKFDMTVDVNSISTGFFIKTMHAKSKDWFDSKDYPNIKFVSSKFDKLSNGYQVTGMLTMHGVSKQVVIPFNFSNHIFEGKFSVNRLDYKLGTITGMSKKIPNEVQLEITVPVIQK